jgi:membrane fusion protein (multidrug efflux system)
MSGMNPPFRLGFLIGIAAVLILVAGCGRSAAHKAAVAAPVKQPVEVVALVRRDMAESLNLVGSLAANETAQLRAELAGQVRAVSFNEGEQVRKDQVLLKIDDAELRAQLAQAEARFKLAGLNRKRSENLTEAQSMSQAEADRVLSEYSSTEAELSLLRVRLAKTEIKAPFDGTVGARAISPGDYITAATVITTIDDLSRMKIDFQVPERFVGKVKPGTTFTVRARSNSGESQSAGTVYFVSSVIDRATRSSQVKGYLDHAQAGLKPGMFASIELVLEIHRGVLIAPEGAILTTPRGTQIVAVSHQGEDEVADFVPVKLGLRAKGLVEVEPVKGRLEDNQKVVASGVGALILYPGAKLELQPQKEQFRVGGTN